MDVSVIVVSWNAKRFLRECLHSLVTVPSTVSTELIVVDNASEDGSAEMVETEFSSVRLIRNSSNVGFAKANNIGISRSCGRYVALVNSDVVIHEDCLGALVDFMDQHTNVGLSGPRILNGDLTLQSSCRNFPSLWNNFCEASGLYRLFSGSPFFSGEHMLHLRTMQATTVDALVGCFWVIRREALLEIGPLDESFFIYGEDIDWCRRCWNLNWSVMYFPRVQAIHYRAGSSANDPIRFAIEQQYAVLQYWDKHRGLFGRISIRSILLGKNLVRLILSTIASGFGGSPRSDYLARVNALLSRHRFE